MDGLKNYREKIKHIEELVNKMESGELSINELVELEKLTHDLHERSIILKYKAFENKRRDFPVDGEIVSENGTEEIREVEEKEIDLFETNKTSVMDFSMFDASDLEEKREELKIEKVDFAEEKKPETQTIFESVGEEKKNESVEESKPPISNPIAEESKAVINEKGSCFLDRLNIVDNSISSQLAGRKIDTLTGAFGINERLLYINELFDGSGEAFSDAVKLLDSQPGLDAASAKIEELAFQNSWNPEEETVLEFLAIIKRRYA